MLCYVTLLPVDSTRMHNKKCNCNSFCNGSLPLKVHMMLKETEDDWCRWLVQWKPPFLWKKGKILDVLGSYQKFHMVVINLGNSSVKIKRTRLQCGETCFPERCFHLVTFFENFARFGGRPGVREINAGPSDIPREPWNGALPPSLRADSRSVVYRSPTCKIEEKFSIFG